MLTANDIALVCATFVRVVPIRARPLISSMIAYSQFANSVSCFQSSSGSGGHCARRSTELILLHVGTLAVVRSHSVLGDHHGRRLVNRVD
jgi:hypothetical protein